MDRPKRLLTVGCGAGTQSTAIYYLMRERRIRKADAAIFADTGNEEPEVLENAAFLARGFEEIGVPFYVVTRHASRTDIAADVMNRQVWATIPAHTVIEKQVRVPLSWKRCTCAWARVFGIGGEKGARELGRFAPGTTRQQILEHSSCTELDCGLFDHYEEEAPDEVRAALMLDEAGFDSVPGPHRPCRSAGRIATSFHEYTKVERGRIRRTCTGKYQIEPIQRQVRELLGAEVRVVPCRYCEGSGARVSPWDVEAGEGPCSVCGGTGQRRRVGSPPAGSRVEHIIGFSADEALDRATTSGFPRYMEPVHPLIDMRISREQCQQIIRSYGRTPVRSACVICPNRGNAEWREMKANRPDQWERACQFDEQFRTMQGLRGQRFVHGSFGPLRTANLNKPTRAELESAQGDLLELLEEGVGGCSPYECGSAKLDELVPTVDLPMPTFGFVGPSTPGGGQLG